MHSLKRYSVWQSKHENDNSTHKSTQWNNIKRSHTIHPTLSPNQALVYAISYPGYSFLILLDLRSGVPIFEYCVSPRTSESDFTKIAELYSKCVSCLRLLPADNIGWASGRPTSALPTRGQRRCTDLLSTNWTSLDRCRTPE